MTKPVTTFPDEFGIGQTALARHRMDAARRSMADHGIMAFGSDRYHPSLQRKASRAVFRAAHDALCEAMNVAQKHKPEET